MKKKISIILLSVILIMSLVGLKPTMAVATTLSATNKTVNSGEEISISISSSIDLTGWTISVSSGGGCTFVSASGGEVNGKSVFGTSSSGTKSLATYKFKAPTVTKDTTYTIKFSGSDMCDVNTDEVSSTTCSATITVKAKVQTSTNTNTNTNNNTNTGTANKEEPKKEEPKKEEVKKGTIDTFYINGIKVKQYLNVTNKDSVSIKVNTSTKEGATVYNSATKKTYKLKSGTATNIQIVEGTNTLTITLDTGHKETRKIYSQKEEVVEPNVIEEKKEEVKVLLKSLGIKASVSEEENVEISLTPEFSSEVYEYNVILDENLADVKKLNIDAVPTSEEFKVEITGNEDLKVGHNTIIITVKSKDEKTTATYKVLVAKLAKIVPVVSEPVTEVKQEVVKPLWNRQQQILISVFTSIIAIMGIVYAVIEYRYKKEPEQSIPNSGTTLEEDLNKDIQIDEIGDIPFAKVGFEKENTDKIDILKEEEYEKQNEESIENNEREENKKTSKRRGKHF